MLYAALTYGIFAAAFSAAVICIGRTLYLARHRIAEIADGRAPQ